MCFVQCTHTHTPYPIALRCILILYSHLLAFQEVFLSDWHFLYVLIVYPRHSTFSVCTYRLSQAQYIFCMYLSFIPGTVHILYVLIAYPRHSTFSVCTYRLSQAQYIFRPSPAVVLLVISTNCVSLDNAVVFASIGTAPLGPDVLSTWVCVVPKNCVF